MTATETDLRRSMRYVLHLGLVELRELGQTRSSHDRIAHLADLLEFLPQFLGDETIPDPEVLREQFEKYRGRYPDSPYRYSEYLDGKEPPAHF